MTRPRWHRYAVAVFPVASGLGAGLGCWGDAFTSAPAGDDASRADANQPLDSGQPAEEAAPADAVASDTQRQDAAGGSGTWCSMQVNYTLCQDFDTGPFPGSSREILAGGGMVSQDTKNFFSAPYSFLAATPSGSASAPVAFLSRTFLKDGQHLRLEEELETGFECVSGTDRVAPLSFSFSNYELIFYVDVAGPNLLELGIGPDGGTTATKLHPLKAAVLGRWVALTFEARLGQTPPIVNMTIAGASVLNNEALTLVPSPPPIHPTMNIGAATTNATLGVAPKACAVHVDNLLFDLGNL
jgi:hypothetical protein